MRPFLAALVLVPSLMLSAAPAQPYEFQPRPAFADGLSGTYVNTSNNGYCTVFQRGDAFVFINENGDRATFSFVSPNRLAIVGTRNWDRNVMATVSRDRFGRTLIRFDAPRTAPGYWVAAD